MLTQEALYLIVTGVAGLLVGLIVASLVNNRDAKTRKTSDPTPEMKADGFGEVTRLWYSPANKNLIVEIDGEFYKNFADLSLDQQKKALRIAGLMNVWVKAEPKGKPVIPPLPITAVPFVNENQAQPFVNSAPVINSQSSPAEKIDQPQPAEVKFQAENLYKESGAIEPEKIKPKTISGQISEILEEMLQKSPMREKGIMLIEREDHGVDVWYGKEKFDGVEAIPYPEVKQMIKEAVMRWEKENT